MTDLVLLAALIQKPAYGYALKKTAGLIFGSRAMHSNVVYPSLKRFIKNGWVEQSSAPGERGQTRKQYRLTSMGRNYLLEQLANFGEHDASDDGAFLFRVAFFDALPKAKRHQILLARKEFLLSRSEQLTQLRQATQPRSFGGVALERVQKVVQDELRWIQRLQRESAVKEGDLQCKQILTDRATVRRS